MSLTSKVLRSPDQFSVSYPAVFGYTPNKVSISYILVPKKNGPGICLYSNCEGSFIVNVGDEFLARDWENSGPCFKHVNKVTIEFTSS